MLETFSVIRGGSLLKCPAPRFFSVFHVISTVIALIAINSMSKVYTAPVSAPENLQTFRYRPMLNTTRTGPRPDIEKPQRPRSQPANSQTPKPSPSALPSTSHDSHITSSPLSTHHSESDSTSAPSNPAPSNAPSPDTQSGKTTLPSPTPRPSAPEAMASAKASQSNLPPPEPTITPAPHQKPPSDQEGNNGDSQNSDGKEDTAEDSENSPGKKETTQNDTSGQESSNSPSFSGPRIVFPLFAVGAALSIVVGSIFFAYRAGLCTQLQSTLSEQPYERVQPEPSPSTVTGNNSGTADVDGWNDGWDVDDWEVDDSRTKREPSPSQEL